MLDKTIMPCLEYSIDEVSGLLLYGDRPCQINGSDVRISDKDSFTEYIGRLVSGWKNILDTSSLPSGVDCKSLDLYSDDALDMPSIIISQNKALYRYLYEKWNYYMFQEIVQYDTRCNSDDTSLKLSNMSIGESLFSGLKQYIDDISEIGCGKDTEENLDLYALGLKMDCDDSCRTDSHAYNYYIYIDFIAGIYDKLIRITGNEGNKSAHDSFLRMYERNNHFDNIKAILDKINGNYLELSESLLSYKEMFPIVMAVDVKTLYAIRLAKKDHDLIHGYE